MDFSAEHRRYGDHTIVTLGGEIDVQTSPRLRELLLKLLEDGDRRFVIDLDGVAFLDSTGLGVLVGLMHRLRAVEGSMVFTGANERIRGIFHVTQLSRVFTVYETLDEALGEGGGEVNPP
ncbi:STAS domain-containing protein [Spirillospora sp. CA-294931]|uniref:STAS domain-containing protein n=1 Tax=Spirillospora sp. CA-294931 TaxID=3240042 RepID=UPI003D9330A9